MVNPDFKLGMQLNSTKILKRAIIEYAIKEGMKVTFEKK